MEDTMTATAWLVVALLVSSAAPSQTEECPSYDTLEEVVYLAHPHDCSLFRRCQAGQPVLGRCPQGQHFNPGSKVCDDPSRAGCTATPALCSSGQPLSTCRYKCTCSRKEERHTCPTQLQFSHMLDVFAWSVNSSCTRDPEDISMGPKKLGHVVLRNTVATASLCPGDKKAPTTTTTTTTTTDHRHFADCGKMVRCEGSAEVVLQCPPGLAYDAELGYCDDPVGVDCGGGAVSSAAPPAGGCPTALPLSSCPYSCECLRSHGKCPAVLKLPARVNITDGDTHPDCRADPSLISISDQYFCSFEVEPKSATFSHCSHNSAPFVADLLVCGRMFRCRGGRERPFYCPNGYQFDLRSNRCVRNPKLCEDDALAAAPAPSPVASTDPELPCPTSATCPSGSGTRVSHLTDCTLFCECVQGRPVLGACSPGLHFSLQAQACDSPQTANCHTFCSKLPSVTGGSWYPAPCNAGDSPEGTECRLQCDSNYQLVGSDVINCTNRGWHGSGGLNQLPSCNTTEQVAQIMINKINATITTISKMDQKAGMLFVLDESGSVEAHNFEIEKNFVEALITSFPLSENRSSGVITFSGEGTAAVDISLRQTSTCDFLGELAAISYSNGMTDMAGALALAKDEIDYSAASGRNTTTLVFAITDGQSQSEPGEAARRLRDSGHIVFTIGVASYDRAQLEPLSSTYKDGSKLFFGLPNFQVFNVVAEYLRTTYRSNATLACP